MSYIDGNYILGSDYVSEIICWVKVRERRANLRFKNSSPQIEKRGSLIEWTRDVAQKLCLSDITFHLAVRLIDLFMDGHDIMDPQLYLVSLGATLLAAKMEEKDSNVPRCTKLNSFVKNAFPIKDFYSIELVMLNYFDWNVCIPTAAYFAMNLLPYAMITTDKLVSGPILNFSKAHAYFEEYVNFFLKNSVSEICFIDKLPSVIGTSVIAASRKAFGLVEAWPYMLEKMSGYSWGELAHIVQRMLFQLSQLSISADEGYGSCSSSPIVTNKEQKYLDMGDF